MRAFVFAKRCAKEIWRDSLQLMFGLGFPITLLLLLSVLQANIPVDIFSIETLTPGIAVFGLSFMTLISSTVVAKDRESAFLQRLYTTPLRPLDFILGYLLPIFPIGILQCAVCYIVAIAIGLPITINIIYAVLALLPVGIFHISLGLLCGCIFNVKQVGGICGALLTNLSAWLSGVWFDLELMGEIFRKVANMLPFVHAVELDRAIISGNFSNVLSHMYPVVGYAIATTVCAICAFMLQMKKE